MNRKSGIIKKITICMLLLIIGTLSISCDNKSEESELVYVHSWTAEGLGGHFYSGANMGAVSWFAVEGLGDFLRTLDYVYLTTAASIIHNDDSTTIVTLRDDIFWQYTNERFVANDVVAFYYLNTGSITKYLFDIKALDDTHVEFDWNPEVEPTNEVKTLLLVTDRVACVPYDVFREYADICKNIYKNATYATDFSSLPTFGRELLAEDSVALSQAYSDYQDFVPEVFPATGPYMIEAYDANEMTLVRNDNWYNKDLVGFDKITLINSVGDASLFSSMLINGSIDMWLNTPSKPVVENILNSNEDIAFYKVPSPYSHGVKLNLQKTDLWTPKVREAIQYLFDRDEIRQLASYYSITSWTSMSGMNDTDLSMWMSDEGYAVMQDDYTYSFDLERAEELLNEAGWTRRAGKWYDQNGDIVELIIGYDGSNSVPSSIAEAIQAQLTNFGIQSSLKRASGYAEFYATATQNNSVYDLVCDNTAYNASYNYPSAAFIELYYSGVGATANLKYLKDETLVGFNGELFHPSDYIDIMLTLKDEELKDAVDNLVIGFAGMNAGINIFQEASGAFYNKSVIAGLPYPQYADENRNIEYIPSGGSQDHIDMLYAILFYDHGSALYNGKLYPATDE